ncbi:MAG: penicillin acylase family protein [Planctomycetota bacterium]|jgi:penicillin amidase
MIHAPLVLSLALAGGVAQFDPAFLQSLPRLEGRVAVEELAAPVTVQRDAMGVPVIEGADLPDVVRAQGFLHGQERMFQMDLLRRRAAGTLAALLGPPALPSDRQMRRHRFAAVADELLARLPDRHRLMLEAYAAGVNAGVADLGAAPPEYRVLGDAPAAWRARDGLLVMLAMFDVLHMNARFEERLGVAAAALPAELVEFLTPEADRFAAPLLAGDDGDGYRPLPVPGPDVVDLGRAPWGDAIDGARGAAAPPVPPLAPPLAAGSNGWVVAGSRGAGGMAMLANDPHLPLTVPNIWYRVQLQWPGRRVVGVSLPGVPGVIIGSNGHVAWGFTNTTGDFQDLVVVEVDPDDPSRYRAPDGYEPFTTITETIEVRGGAAVTLELQSTRWGVVTDHDFRGRPLVLKWTALHPSMINMEILDIGLAESLEEGLAIARRWWGPSQNVMIADREGRIGWVVSGYLPKRVGFDGKTPRSWADGDVGWEGALPESERPVVVDPDGGALFTANQRTLPTDRAHPIGRAWAPPVRAWRIRERLAEKVTFDHADLLDVQLDTRSPAHDFYRDLALAVTADDDEDEDLRAARAAVERWDGTADVEAVGLPVLEAMRRELLGRIVDPLVAPCRALDPGYRHFWFLVDEPVRRILEERPPHLLPPGEDDWDEVVRDALRDAVRRVRERSGADDVAVTWGAINRARIAHPLAAAAPAYARLLNMPESPLPGNLDTIRVAGRGFGASMRLVVSPGREELGVLHMPGGQSGHPLSPHYRNGHAAWLEGRPAPLLAGDPTHTLRLVPPAPQEIPQASPPAPPGS